MNDLPDPRFLALIQAHRLLDAKTVSQLRATQGQWLAQGRAVSLFQLAAHHRLLPPHVLQGLLQASGQAPARQPPAQEDAPSEPPPETKPRPKAPARRSASSRLVRGRSSQRNAPVGRRASQRSTPQRSGSLLPLYLGTVVIGGLVAVLGWRLLSPGQDARHVSEAAIPEASTETLGTGVPREESVEPSSPSLSAAAPVEPRTSPRPEEPASPGEPAAPDGLREEGVGDPDTVPELTERDPQRAAALAEARRLREAAQEAIQRNDATRVLDLLGQALRLVDERAPGASYKAALLADLAHTLWQVGNTKGRDEVAGELLEVAVATQKSEYVDHAFRLGMMHKNDLAGVGLIQGVLENCSSLLTTADRADAAVALAYAFLHRDVQRSRAYLEQARAVLRDVRPEDEPVSWYSLWVTEGQLLFNTGSLGAAKEAYGRSQAIAHLAFPDPNSLALLADRVPYGDLLRVHGRREEARQMIEGVLAEVRKHDAHEFGQLDVLADALGVLATLEQEAGDVRRELELRLEVLELRRRTKTGNLAATLTSAAQAATRAKEVDLAFQLWDEALANTEGDFPTWNLAKLLTDSGTALAQNGKLTDGLKRLNAALCVVTEYSDQLVRALTPAERIQAAQKTLGVLNNWLWMTKRVQPASTGYEGVIQVRRYLARASEVLRRSYRTDPSLERRVERLAQADAALGRLMYAKPPDPSQHEAWERAVDAARTTRDRLNLELVNGSAVWKGGLRRLRARLADVQRELRDGEVLVDYVRVGNWMMVFVVHDTGDVVRVELGRPGPIEAACARFHALAAEAPESREAAAALGRAGRELHALIWKPLEEAVGKATFVYVVPDGPLATVPFAALPGRRPGSVLYEDHPLGFLAHPQDLLPWPDAPPPGVGALAVGGVDYDRAATKTPEGLLDVPEPRRITLEEAMHKAPAGMQFGPLQGTLPEARACLTYYHEATKQDEIYLLHGPFATEAHLRRYAPGRRLLHLSTHGFVRLDLAETTQSGARLDPLLLTGLALAGCNRTEGGGGDDGILTAHEAAQLNLDGVELVILSACQTAQGSTRAGEAVIGLTSAFREAGATSVVSSLWPVSDQATAMLMELFYRLVLVEGVPPPVALQKSALTLRAFEVEHEGKRIRPFEAPCYWSAFVSYGPFR